MSLPKAEEWTDPGPMDPLPKRGRGRAVGAAVVLAALIGSALIWRATNLWGLPDIGEPFDLIAKGTVTIPDNENAFTYYRVAVAKLQGRPSTAPRARYLNWSQINQHDRDWYMANLEPLKIWLAGTSMERAVFIQPKDQSVVMSTLDLVQDMRTMPKLATIAAMRMESMGEFEEAWTLYRAALRSSRHCAMHGSFIERLIAMAIYNAMSANILAWSDQPNLSVELLRKALNDLLAIEEMTPSLRENFEAEYFAFSRMLDDPDVTTWKVKEVMGSVARETPPTIQERAHETFWRIARREPERSRRAIRLVWANWLAVADLPASERAKRLKTYPVAIIFNPPADAPASARLLSPDELNRWVESTRLLRILLPATSALEKALANERAVHARLIIHLAERLYTREHNKPPESDDQLVGSYLKALPEGYEPEPIKP